MDTKYPDPKCGVVKITYTSQYEGEKSESLGSFPVHGVIYVPQIPVVSLCHLPAPMVIWQQEMIQKTAESHKTRVKWGSEKNTYITKVHTHTHTYFKALKHEILEFRMAGRG